MVKQANRLEMPAALQGRVWLSVQTHQARQLIHGRKGNAGKATIIGLVGFADRLRLIWQASRDDDPYADWWLIKVHKAIETARAEIDNRQVGLTEQLAQLPAMEISIAASQQPYRISLNFVNPYAYRAAQLLGAFDSLMCTALTARHIGLLVEANYQQVVQDSARQLRALFLIPQGYRYLKIDRIAVQQASARSLEAKQAMGEVPAAILSGEQRPPLAPRKLLFPTGMRGQINLQPGSVIPHDKQHDEANIDS